MLTDLTESVFIEKLHFEVLPVPSEINGLKHQGWLWQEAGIRDFKYKHYEKQATSANSKYLFIFYGVCAWDFDRFLNRAYIRPIQRRECPFLKIHYAAEKKSKSAARASGELWPLLTWSNKTHMWCLQWNSLLLLSQGQDKTDTWGLVFSKLFPQLPEWLWTFPFWTNRKRNCEETSAWNHSKEHIPKREGKKTNYKQTFFKQIKKNIQKPKPAWHLI